MPNKVRVYGNAQNRTALGIANAYLVMYPDATLDDLNKAFPIALNSSKRAETVFVDSKDPSQCKTTKKGESTFERYFFEKNEEILKLQDGTKACMLELWAKSDFEKIVDHAKQYAIEVVDYKPAKPFTKGGFRLEYLDGYVPPAKKSKKLRGLLWLLSILLLIGGIVLFFLKNPVIIEKIIEKEVIKNDTIYKEVIKNDTIYKEVIKNDTVYIQQLAEIEKKFNAARFEVGKSNLSDEAKFVLYDLAKLLNDHPELKLRIIGHTSKEGSEDFNQKLSEARAKAAVDFLVNRGIAISRLKYRGVGSSRPVDTTQLDVNRRTEFRVIE